MQDSWLFEPGLKKQSLAVSNEETEDLTYVLGAQKNCLICFGGEIRKLNFRYALLIKVLQIVHFFTYRLVCWTDTEY